MGKKLTPFENELYQRTDEVMHFVWDPIGVAGIPQARDEYDAYLPRVFSMLLEQRAEDEIAAYLVDVEGRRMGLTPAPEKAARVAEVLAAWYRAPGEKYTDRP